MYVCMVCMILQKVRIIDKHCTYVVCRINPQWRMRASYYSEVYCDGIVEIFFLDSVSLCPEESQSLTGRRFDPEEKKQQMKWLRKALKVSTASWLLVCGHYPIYSW